MSFIIRLSLSLSFMSFDMFVLEGMALLAVDSCFTVSSSYFILWLKVSYFWEEASEDEDSLSCKSFVVP